TFFKIKSTKLPPVVLVIIFILLGKIRLTLYIYLCLIDLLNDGFYDRFFGIQSERDTIWTSSSWILNNITLYTKYSFKHLTFHYFRWRPRMHDLTFFYGNNFFSKTARVV